MNVNQATRKSKSKRECDQEAGLDSTFKADNQIVFDVSWANVIIGCMVRKLISTEANLVLRYLKPKKNIALYPGF